MLIDELAEILSRAEAFEVLLERLGSRQDATLAVPQSARPLVTAALFAVNPRSTLVVLSGEDAALRYSQALAAYLGRDAVSHLPERRDTPWSDASKPNLQTVGQRCRALYALGSSAKHVVCASARSLLRCVPPAEVDCYSPVTLECGMEIEPDAAAQALVSAGYSRLARREGPGTFALRGDTLELHPADLPYPVRVEFFGDEIEACRRLVPGTGQSIGDLNAVQAFPCRELRISKRSIERLLSSKGDRRLKTDEAKSEISMISQGIAFPQMEKYLPFLYAKVGSPLDHVCCDALVEVVEPRSLFDDASRAYDEISARAKQAKASLEGLFTPPAKLDFGTQQRLTMLSLIRAGGAVDAELAVKRPDVSGTQERILGALRSFVAGGYTTIFALPDRKIRRSVELDMSDASIPFAEHLDHPLEDEGGNDAPLDPRVVQVVDTDIPCGMVIRQCKLCLISLSDARARSARSARRNTRKTADPTAVSFPFKPGDYVVHSHHGIALFKELCSREVAGVMRDYLLLEYASADKLFVPVEQVDQISRYIGPQGASPRLTRLNTADWARTSARARKNAKKLAFDLVDLYARRSTVQGFKYSPDTPWQKEMEQVFPFEETPDQLAAIADVKADMESDRPMDRLICGDVGFGKTEVVLRAAFKATQDGRQVMMLCPTTILAQQHFTTFLERLSPFGVNVEVLSRFRTASQQKAALEGFTSGAVDMLIGTHRLLSRDVNPKNLGLVIIDEEQRFGVGHKEMLKTLREQTDVLSLSATPIPRTMQMALSGVRDMSLILTPPKKRMPVKVHVGEWDADLVSAAIRFEMERGGQVYYVSNRVKGIEGAVERVLEVAPEARIGVAHGQMREKELEEVMERFSAGQIDVLVATTIIESGIDNPHTNTLVIEDSQRLGLAQLYQLKGRVGRSFNQAFAYFLFPKEESLTEEASNRLQAISEFQDLGSGTRIAMRDLEIRGAGNMLGAEQSGNISSVGFDLYASMIAEAVSAARGEQIEELPEVRIELPGHFYLPEEYIPAADERVLVYRRLASLASPEEVSRLEKKTASDFGALPAPAQNLFERARIRACALCLGVNYVAEVGSKLVFSPVDLNREQHRLLTQKRGVCLHAKHKAQVPVPYGASSVTFASELLGQLAELSAEGGDIE